MVVRGALAGIGAVVACVVAVLAVLAVVQYATPHVASGTPSVAAGPSAFRDREQLASCGRVAQTRGDAIAADRIACLTDGSAAGRELVVTTAEADGARRVRWFRVLPGEPGIVVWAEQVRAGAADRWTRTVCGSGRIDQFGACA